MNHNLIHAWGPTPSDPEDARLLGCEEAKLSGLLEDGRAFVMYCHAASVPELVSYVRTVGRDCTFEPFARTQARLLVRGRT